MDQFCPLATCRTQEVMCRLNALLTFLIIIGSFFYPLIMLLLFFDFFIRGFLNPQYSILVNLNKLIVEIFHIQSKSINAGPKIFSAKIGCLVSLLACMFLLLKFDFGLYVCSIILLVCSFLEAFFGLCLGCNIYGFLYSKQ